MSDERWLAVAVKEAYSVYFYYYIIFWDILFKMIQKRLIKNMYIHPEETYKKYVHSSLFKLPLKVIRI
uniref:Uncharacterized protein n=1 Tax=Lepeophtheirus salmonis TaxID=72036 RepID=A0A0K2VJB9_LEPSM